MKNGWTREGYEQARKDQDCKCAICHKPETEKRKLAGDHDHPTGQPRALLCVRCNTVLGQIHDDPVLLQEMIEYLQKHKKPLSI